MAKNSLEEMLDVSPNIEVETFQVYNFMVKHRGNVIGQYSLSIVGGEYNIGGGIENLTVRLIEPKTFKQIDITHVK